MIRLGEITEENWVEAAGLELEEEQKRYVASPLGILARGYVFRDSRARVFTVEEDGRVVGLTLVRDLDEEPAVYDLQQLLIDRRYQNRGIGTEALRQLLALLEEERKYPAGEVCVKKEDGPALRVYEKTGFADTGYIDEDAPDSLNLMHRFGE